MNAINIIEHADGEMKVSTAVIANGMELEHRQVIRAVRSNMDDLRQFGRVDFENQPFVTAGGEQRREVAHLNEHQATFLLTSFRNIGRVKEFKLELVKQFYAMRQELASAGIPKNLPDALRAYALEVERASELEAKVAADAPKVLFADAVSTSDSTILVGELAKILKGNGVEVGANRLFEWLRRDGFLIRRRGSDWNMPTQRAMELGLFRIKETAVTHSDGHVSVNKTPKVTGKGQTYFVNHYGKSESTAAVAS